MLRWPLPALPRKQGRTGLQVFCYYKALKPICSSDILSLLGYRSQKQLSHLTYWGTSCWFKKKKRHYLRGYRAPPPKALCSLSTTAFLPFQRKNGRINSPKHKYYDNIVHLIGLTKCFYYSTLQHRWYVTRYEVTWYSCKYLQILRKQRFGELQCSLLIKVPSQLHNSH